MKISGCYKHNPIRTFPAKYLKKATTNYDPSLIFHDNGYGRWCKGSLEGRPVSVRNFGESDPMSETRLQSAIREIAVAIKMSNHRSVLKLLGCCLETPIPTLVYEFPAIALLEDRIIPDTRGTHSQPLKWKIRLKIAFEIAHFISYLHTAFPRPIIHRDIKLSEIFLDEHFVPKLSEFSLSVVLHEGETHLADEVCGTLGYLAPECQFFGTFTEKIDVYAFGVILLELLTGQRALIRRLGHIVSYASRHARIHGINGIVDPNILEEGSAGILQLQQFQAVLRLAGRCTKKRAEKRPTSTEVAKQLRRIQRGMLEIFENDFVLNLAQVFKAAAGTS